MKIYDVQQWEFPIVSSEGQTIFHKIIRREIPADIIFEDDQTVAFRDINPVAPVHVLIVPKANLKDIDSADESHAALLGHLMLVANKVAKQLGLSEKGYRLVVNNGSDGGQTVFQLHIHLLGGRSLDWPPG